MSTERTGGAEILEYPVTPPELPRDPTPERLKLSPRRSPGSPGSPGSPDSRCPICLARQENRAFTDGCMHRFCFTCIQEWSKVRAVCPLCKQPFTSIIHNVRSDRDYDRYTLPEPPRPPVDPAHLISQSLLYRPGDVLTTSRWARRQYRFHAMLAPMLWRPHTPIDSVEDLPDFHLPTVPSAPRSRRRPSASVSWPRSRVTSHQRRQIYVDDMWARPSADQLTGRYRETGPEFYRANPACTHRLVPWLNRELTAILSPSDQQLPNLLRTITNQLNIILEQLQRVHILSHQFRRQLQCTLGSWTEHFVHELYTFARSPYDMVGYDLTVQYGSGRPDSTLSTVVIDSSNSASANEEDGDGAGGDIDVVMMGARDSPMRHIASDHDATMFAPRPYRVGTSWRHSQSSDSDIQVVMSTGGSGSPEPGPSGALSSLAEFGAMLQSSVSNRQHNESLEDEAATSNNEQREERFSGETDDVQVVRVLPPLSARAELVTLSDSEPTASLPATTRRWASSRRSQPDCESEPGGSIASSSHTRSRQERNRKRRHNPRHEQQQQEEGEGDEQQIEERTERKSKHKKRKRRRREPSEDNSVDQRDIPGDDCTGSKASRKLKRKRSRVDASRRRRSESRRHASRKRVTAADHRDAASTTVSIRIALDPVDSHSSSDQSVQVALAAVSNEPLTSRSLRLKRRKLRCRQQLRNRVRRLSSLSASESDEERPGTAGVERERSWSNSSRLSTAATVGSHLSAFSEEHSAAVAGSCDVTAAAASSTWSTRGNLSDVSASVSIAPTASTSRQRDSTSSSSSSPQHSSPSPQRSSIRSLVVLPHGVTLDLNADRVSAE